MVVYTRNNSLTGIVILNIYRLDAEITKLFYI